MLVNKQVIEMLEENTRNLILKTLKKAEHSLTIDEVSKRTNIHRVTATKYLAVMEAMGNVKMRKVGKAKLFLLRDKHEK